MAVTGIANGYNMYGNPYDARVAGRSWDTGNVARTNGMQDMAGLPGASGNASGVDGARYAAGWPGASGNASGADGARNAAGLPGKPRNAAGMPEAMQNAAMFGRGRISPADAGDPDAVKKAGRKSSPEECQTCKERKYQDGSDENVSFKAAAHISPEAAGAAVRAHEGEHVSNAYKKAAEDGGKVINASVMIHTAICPECGRTYVSGGTTSTTIRYSKEENPYEKAKKAQEAIKLRGKNIDYAA